MSTPGPLYLLVLVLLILMALILETLPKTPYITKYLLTCFSITLNLFMLPTSVTAYIPTYLTSFYVVLSVKHDNGYTD